MYELVWTRSGYRIVKVKKHFSDRVTDWPTWPTGVQMPDQSKRVDRQVWRQFVSSGKADLSAVNPPIIDSWHRCRDMGVDPALGKCRDIRDTRDMGPESHLLLDMTAQVRTYISDLVRDRGLLVTISDRQGYLIHSCGDYRVLLTADKLNFGPGANWSEASVGTNAIGTALASGQAIMVTGREHFCEDHQSWICSAAPIFDLDGRMIGCIDISGPTTADHHQALTLAMNGATAVESQLVKQGSIDWQERSIRIFSSVFNAVATGLVVLDTGGTIKSANPAAALVLNQKQERIAGCRAEAFFEMENALAQLQAAPDRHANRGFAVRVRRMGTASARVWPITTPNGTITAFLLVLEATQTRPLISLPAENRAAVDAFAPVIGKSLAIRSAVDIARRVARRDTTVLITGESGTGKEIVARAVHAASPRANAPFVAVNCGAIPHELIQSELFGYAQGAFTGAKRGGHPGKFEQASGGTLFLDEIAEMPPNLQVNLLRVLEEGHVTRVGGKRPITVDVRIIAATNQNLSQRVRRNAFREDLFYRLNVVQIGLPPLRQRGRDIDLLAMHFIARISATMNQPIRRVDPSFCACLHHHDWPGNVRELKHAIEGAIALMPGAVLGDDCLIPKIKPGGSQALHPDDVDGFNLKAVEKTTIQRAHAFYAGNISRMAKSLGIGRNTLYAKLRRYDIL